MGIDLRPTARDDSKIGSARMTTNSPSTDATPRPWSYEIQYGPNGEEVYAWVCYRNLMVCTVKVHHAKMIVEAVNAYERLTTENAELRRERDEARALVRLHHDWHLQSGIIGLQDGEGGWIEINNASEYSDSLMYERSQAFLENQPTEFKPMPRGGISAWWWQVAVLQRRQLRAAEARADALQKVLERARIAVDELCNGQHPDNECWNILREIDAALAKMEVGK